MAANYDQEAVYADPTDVRIESVAKLEEKWMRGNRKNDVCLALALDPAISGQPDLSVVSEVWCFEAPVEVCASIVSNGWVHFAKLHVNLDGEADIEVAARTKIKVSDYGMLLAIIGQQLAEENQLLNPGDIPGILFGSEKMLEWYGLFSLETLDEAKKLTKVLRAGQEFIKRL
jgi:hypothetical protein